jgi:hypothetical protein
MEPWRAGGGRAHRARPPLHRQRNPFHFDTRHNSFGVLSPGLRRIVGEVFCSNRREQAPVNQPHHFTMPEPGEAVSSQSLLTTGTTWLNPVAFTTSPFFHVSCAAASVSTRINTRYQPDNRCRQRHRVRKAVFVQLVCIRPKAFYNVFRPGQ